LVKVQGEIHLNHREIAAYIWWDQHSKLSTAPSVRRVLSALKNHARVTLIEPKAPPHSHHAKKMIITTVFRSPEQYWWEVPLALGVVAFIIWALLRG
jgi:hypothetical protein